MWRVDFINILYQNYNSLHILKWKIKMCEQFLNVFLNLKSFQKNLQLNWKMKKIKKWYPENEHWVNQHHEQ